MRPEPCEVQGSPAPHVVHGRSVDPHPSPPSAGGELRKNRTVFVSPVKTGVQSICNSMKTLDSGYRRNDVKQHQTNFFTASGDEGEGGPNLFG